VRFASGPSRPADLAGFSIQTLPLPIMSTPLPLTTFDQADLAERLHAMSREELDALPFGVIGFDDKGVVTAYNSTEAGSTGMSRERALGLEIFTSLAQCMNNFLVAQRFDDARDTGTALDATIDFVLTWRMKPTNVKLRLLSSPGQARRHVVIHRVP
jgi:photoactive yellow protein